MNLSYIEIVCQPGDRSTAWSGCLADFPAGFDNAFDSVAEACDAIEQHAGAANTDGSWGLEHVRYGVRWYPDDWSLPPGAVREFGRGMS